MRRYGNVRTRLVQQRKSSELRENDAQRIGIEVYRTAKEWRGDEKQRKGKALISNATEEQGQEWQWKSVEAASEGIAVSRVAKEKRREV